MCWEAFSVYTQTDSELIVFDCKDVRILKLYHLQSAFFESWHQHDCKDVSHIDRPTSQHMEVLVLVFTNLCIQIWVHTCKPKRDLIQSVFCLWLQTRAEHMRPFCGSARTLLWLLDATLVLPQLLRPAGNLYNLFHPHLRARSLPRRWAHTLQNPLPRDLPH